MWVVFGTDFKMGDANRSMYYFFRHLDDVLDGDRAISQDPFLYASGIRSCLEERNFDVENYPILGLAKRALEHCDMVKRSGDDPQSDMLQLIDAMVFDRFRMQSRMVLSKQDLLAEYQRQFYPIINLQLISLGSKVRVADIPDFPIVQGRVYGLRDMESDWNKGLINIPAEVLEAAGLDAYADFKTVRASAVIQQWMQDECIDCGKAIDIENQRLATSLDNGALPREKITRVIFEHLIDEIVKYIANNVTLNSNGQEENHNTQLEHRNLLPVIAVRQALQLSLQYAKDLEIKPSEIFRYLKKSASLAACYAGFAQNLSRDQAAGAGKAAFLSCAYDVVSDWGKSPALCSKFEQILNKEVSVDLADMALGLLNRDLNSGLEYDGLERGIVATRFVLEMMGLKEFFRDKVDVDELGVNLQIVDDVLDYESDIKAGDQNCLTSLKNRYAYLRQLLDFFDEQRIDALFPHAGVLGIAIRRARNKTINMFTSSQGGRGVWRVG